METILETSAAVVSVRQSFDGPAAGQPRTEWIRGVCPLCGSPVVSNCYYVGGRGYLVVWECWESLREFPACQFRRVV